MGLAAMRSVVCRSLRKKERNWVSNAVIWLSTEAMMACRISFNDWSMSATRGFFSLLLATRSLRRNWVVLYSAICCSMAGFSMPEFAGSSWF